MNAIVRDCMNHQLVYMREGGRADLALKSILDFGITTVAVLDEDHRPVGTVSIRELADPKHCRDWVTTPAATISIDAPLATAAQTLAEKDLHQIVVVNTDGRAAGMLSALDVVRGLLGIPARHPKAIDSFDRPAASR